MVALDVVWKIGLWIREKTEKSPLPKIEEAIDEMDGSNLFTKLAAKGSGERSRKTSFRCQLESSLVEAIPLLLMSILSTFQRMVESIFRDLYFMRVYIDDIFIGFKSVEEQSKPFCSCIRPPEGVWPGD